MVCSPKTSAMTLRMISATPNEAKTMVSGPAFSRSRLKISRSAATAVAPVTAIATRVARASAVVRVRPPHLTARTGTSAANTASKTSAT